MIYSAITALALAATASAALFPDDKVQQKNMWENFKSDHGKSYSSLDEASKRFDFFMENMKMADVRNAAEIKAGGSAVHGITKFSDLSQAEFESRYLTAHSSMKSAAKDLNSTDPFEPSASMGLVDWTGKLTTPVKDQGHCNSGLAFSIVEQAESDTMRLFDGTSFVLSSEEVVQCDIESKGCNGGGDDTTAYDNVLRHYGLQTESDYPYTSYQGATGVCHADSSKSVVKFPGNLHVSTGEEFNAFYVQGTGPQAICIDASKWNTYTGGVMYDCGDAHTFVHCVQVVGVDAWTYGYWKIRNSWGTDWGELGHIRISYGANTCGINTAQAYWTDPVLA